MFDACFGMCQMGLTMFAGGLTSRAIASHRTIVIFFASAVLMRTISSVSQ